MLAFYGVVVQQDLRNMAKIVVWDTGFSQYLSCQCRWMAEKLNFHNCCNTMEGQVQSIFYYDCGSYLRYWGRHENLCHLFLMEEGRSIWPDFVCSGKV